MKEIISKQIFFFTCSIAFPLSFQSHHLHCPRFPVVCPNRCQTSGKIPRDELDRHGEFCCKSVHSSVHTFSQLSVHTFVHSSVRLSIRSSVSPSVRPSICPTICPFLCPSVCTSIHRSVHPSDRPYAIRPSHRKHLVCRSA